MPDKEGITEDSNKWFHARAKEKIWTSFPRPNSWSFRVGGNPKKAKVTKFDIEGKMVKEAVVYDSKIVVIEGKSYKEFNPEDNDQDTSVYNLYNQSCFRRSNKS